MKKITFIGDVHGKTDRYQKILRQKFVGQRTFQVGDMGIGFKGVPGLHKDIMTSGDHKWIRGNHDDPEKCKGLYGYMGDYGYLPEDKLFFLGGAYSIDYAWRVPGVSWWAGEENSMEQLQKAIDLFIEVKPEYVVSHDCPSRISEYMLQVVIPGFRNEKLECMHSRTAAALQQMLDIHMPKEWVFGHYHIDQSFTWRGTKFTCVSELSTYTISDEPLIVEG
jgi:hypothetical protein